MLPDTLNFVLKAIIYITDTKWTQNGHNLMSFNLEFVDRYGARYLRSYVNEKVSYPKEVTVS
jgi:hypothetical protein